MTFKYLVKEDDSGRTIHSILKGEFKFSDRLIKKIKAHKSVFCNQIPVYVTHVLTLGDLVQANIAFEEKSANIKAIEMDLNILYEDDAVIVLDKPANTVINPIGIHLNNAIANGLVYYFQSKGYEIKIRPVSRLDLDTTGIILFAKNGFIHHKLSEQMKANEYHREYIGIVHGCPSKLSGTINLPIARRPDSIILREVSDTGAISITNYRVKRYLKNSAILAFSLETGRTHQIRVHCKAIGHPLIGDKLYSHIHTNLIQRQALHSSYLRFIHPITNKSVEISSSMPKDIAGLIDKLSL